MKNLIRACGQTVASFLNEGEEPARLRIEEFVSELLEVTKQSEFAPDDEQWETIGEGQFLPEPNSQLSQRVHSIERKMNRRYKPSFRIIIPTKGDPRLRFLSVGDTTEAEVAIALKTLAQEGWSTLSLLRKCGGCSKPNKATWFFASRSDKKCCDVTCRQKKLEATRHFRESRNLYMKIKYWRERGRDLRSRIANLPETRKRQKTEAQLMAEAKLKEKLEAARAKIEAAEHEREQLNVKEESK